MVSGKRPVRASRAIPRALVADAVTERLRAMILSGQFRDGAPLRQDALAEEMNTSRIPVREALSRLEGEGLVASYPHRGYEVIGLSRTDIEELFELRTLLEPELIRHAIPRMTQADFDRAEAIQRDFNLAMADGDIHRWGELNRLYHLALYAPAKRTRTLEIVRGLLVNADRYTRLVLTATQDGIRSAKEDHDRLLDLCRRGQVNQAVALTRDHIVGIGEELLRVLDIGGESPSG
jgi:DNA-binding GntR family transcriptional regulator